MNTNERLNKNLIKYLNKKKDLNMPRGACGRGGAVVRARASDIVVGGWEFESRHCHLTGHIYRIKSCLVH